MCAVSLYLENEPCGVFDQELDAAFPSFERGNLRVRGLTRGSSRELPRNLQGKQILLLAPVVRKPGSQPVDRSRLTIASRAYVILVVVNDNI